MHTRFQVSLELNSFHVSDVRQEIVKSDDKADTHGNNFI